MSKGTESSIHISEVGKWPESEDEDNDKDLLQRLEESSPLDWLRPANEFDISVMGDPESWSRRMGNVMRRDRPVKVQLFGDDAVKMHEKLGDEGFQNFISHTEITADTQSADYILDFANNKHKYIAKKP